MTFDLVTAARALAIGAHAGQLDSLDQPYIRHVESVAVRVSVRSLAVAWCHDVLEDTAVSLEAIKWMFSSDELTALQLLTRKPGVEYSAYIHNIWGSRNIAAGKIAMEVKIADLRSNLDRNVELAKRSPQQAAFLKKRYEEALEYLQNGPEVEEHLAGKPDVEALSKRVKELEETLAKVKKAIQ